MLYADEIGLAVIQRRLAELEAQHGEQFRPSALLTRMASEGGRLQDLPPRQGRAARFLPAA
jgi:3-hydroxyacyl-CoA dehydrogenase